MNPPAPFLIRFFRLVLCVAVLVAACTSALAQAAGSDYTKDLPSVERVKAEIKGSDATDTLARQAAVFNYLVSYIDRIKYNRTVRGPYTPGEQQMMGAYRLAAYQISQDYAKSHTPAQAADFERLHGQYEMNSPFYADWSKRLIGPQTAAAYKGAEAGLAATAKKHYDEEMAQYKKDSAAQQAADKQIFGTQGLSNDPTAVATRRCLELNGSNAGCLGHGLMSGFKDLIGFTPDVEESLTGPGVAGVVLSGTYKNPSATPFFRFSAGTANLDGCGKLVEQGHSYTIEKRAGAVKLTVVSEPTPIVLTMRADGGLTGPGLIDVKGQIIIGYHTVTTTQMVNGMRASPEQCNGPCQTTQQVPDYAPAMARCNIGSLLKPPDPKPVSPSAKPAQDSGILGLVSGITDMLSPGAGAPGSDEVGLRMSGQYGGGMLLLDFSGNSLVIDCGQAHVRAPYKVENAAGGFLVHVQNSGSPFSLSVQPDNSLRGAGSATINGKLVTGMNGDDVTFAPHSETCDVGTLRPKNGSSASSSVAAAAPVPAAAVPAAAAGVARADGGPAAGNGGVTARLAVGTSFPGGPNPLAGAGVALMSERFDIALRKAGGPIPANATPGQALAAYSINCLAPGKSCPQYAQAMHPYYISKATFDSSGAAVLTGPPGNYYVIASGSTKGVPTVWDVPLTLKSGENAVTLTSANGELLK